MSGSDTDPVVWIYEPNYPLATVGTILYGLIFVFITYQTVLRYRAWFFIAVVVGAALEVVGYALRAYSTQNQTEIGPFVATLTLVVLAPVFVAAGNFVLVGRLIRAVLPVHRHRVLGLPARWITRVFVACEILAFLVQGSGSAIASSDNWTGPNKDIGERVLIGGLSFQFVAFSAYLCVLVRFHVLATKHRLEIASAPEGWRKVVKSVYISGSMIMVRCIFRVAEFAEGIDGYAFRNEWMFWVFECVPMLVAIGVFCVWHPSRYLGRDGAKSQFAMESSGTSLENAVEAGDAELQRPNKYNAAQPSNI